MASPDPPGAGPRPERTPKESSVTEGGHTEFKPRGRSALSQPLKSGVPANDDETLAWCDLKAPDAVQSEVPEAPETTGAAGAAPEDELGWFNRVIVENGLIEPAELGAILRRLERRAGGLPLTPDTLARELVRKDRLTAYQAAALLQGKSKGLVIGNYLVLDRIGAGGMGIVFKARHRRMKKVVALKVLPPSFSKDKVAVIRFRREAEAAAHLSHPNIVAALDADEFKGLHFLVMDYVEGCDLSHLVRNEEPLPVGLAVDYVIQAARGLSEAHARGIIHRDIKPSNLLLDGAGIVKVSDLGLARMERAADLLGSPHREDDDLTREGAMMGTVDFMSPEQAYNSKQADHRSDIYSLGCTLYYLLTGRVPFPDETLMARLLAHREIPPPPLRELRPDVPLALDHVYQTMLAKAPEARHQSMDALIAGLQACPPAPTRREEGASPVTRGAVMATVREGRIAPTQVIPGRAPGRTIVETVLVVSPVPRSQPDPAVHARSRPLGVPRRAMMAVAVLALSLSLAMIGFFAGRRLVAPGDEQVGGSAPREASEKREQVAPSRTSGPTTVLPTAPAVPVTVDKKPVLVLPERIGVVRAFRHGEGAVEAVAISADGTRVLTGGNDGVARLWDMETRQPRWHLRHDGPVFTVAISADGRRALTAGGDKVVKLWDLDTGRDLGHLEGHTKKVNAVSFSPGGGRLATAGDDGMVRIWDAETRRQLVEVRHEGRVNALAFGSRGLQVLSAGSARVVRILDTSDGSEFARLGEGESAMVFCLAVSPDGRLALWGGDGGRLLVAALDSADHPPPRRLEGGPRDWVRCVAFLPDNRHAIAGYEGGKLLVWDLDPEAEDGAIAHTFDEDHAGHMGVAVLPDGAHALTADDDGFLRLWHLPSLGPRREDRR